MTTNRLAAALLGDDEHKKQIAWNNTALSPLDTACVDCDGRLIFLSDYGKNTAHGWHVDHKVPIALGGTDATSNLRARHWLGNCRAGGLLGDVLGKSNAGLL